MFPILKHAFGSLGWYTKQDCRSLEDSVVRCRCRSRFDRYRVGIALTRLQIDLSRCSFVLFFSYWATSALRDGLPDIFVEIIHV